jgi:hypothetical protein
MRTGRPSKLTPEIKVKAAEYLKQCIEESKVPHAAGMAVHLNVTKHSLYNWADHDDDFLHTLAELKTLQEATLIDGSITGKLNTAISKLMLANHGYKDKQDITSDDKSISPILVKFVGEDDDRNTD